MTRSRRSTAAAVATSIAVTTLALAAAGCAMPVKDFVDRAGDMTNAVAGSNKGENRNARNRANANDPAPATLASRTVAGQSGDDGKGPVNEMRVGRETVSAKELWQGEFETLDEQRRNGPGAYARYVQERAAQLVTDKAMEMLLFQHASDRMPPAAEQQIETHVDTEIRKIITAEHGGIQRRFDRSLEKKGMTLDQFRQRIRREVIIAGYVEQELKPKVAEPTRAQLWDLYQESLTDVDTPHRRRMSVIECRYRDPRLAEAPRNAGSSTAESDRHAARRRAEAILKRIRAGEDFAAIARAESDGVRATDGGSWGYVNRDEVRDRYAPVLDALQKLDTGQVSPVVETGWAYFVVRCDHYDKPIPPDFEASQTELKKRHYRQAMNRLVNELVNDLRTRTRIDPPDLERFHAAAVNAAMERKTPPTARR